MEIIKIALIGVVCAFISLYLKQYKSEYAQLCAIAGGIVLVVYVFPYIAPIIAFFQNLCIESNIDFMYIKLIIKLIVCGYITQFCADICRDCDQSALASKLEMCGRVLIVYLSMPMVISLFEFIYSVI